MDWWSRYYETVKDIERSEEEMIAKESQKEVAVTKKDKKDKDNEPPKPVKKPNPKITRIKVGLLFCLSRDFGRLVCVGTVHK